MPRPIIIGHRGSAGRFPENTLSAFRAGIEVGAEVIELDYQHSADGIPIVIHDATLERTTNAEVLWGKERLAVSERTADELSVLDAGGKFDPHFKDERLPTLAAALELIQASRVTMIERKAGDAATLLHLLRAQNCESDVVVQAFDWDFLRVLRQLSQDVVLGALCKEELTPVLVGEAADIGVEIITWKQEILDSRGIELIHESGRQAWTYTVNDAARAKELIAAGLDGLISNFPNEMMKLRS
jgi:glycerophosphoryl diester phosphodiesterase